MVGSASSKDLAEPTLPLNIQPRRIMQKKLLLRLAPWFYLFVPVGLLLLFTYLPVANMFSYSFTSWDGLDKQKDWVGLDNYIRIFTDPEIFAVFRVSLYYLAGAFLQLGLALYLATILSFELRAKNFFKGVIFFPYLINGVAIGFVFLYLFQGDGALDLLLKFFGLDFLVQQWLGNPDVVNWSMTGTSVWRYLGFNVVLYLGAIASIQPELFEASELDGANRWHQFRYIILPSIKRITLLTMILAISGSLSVFEIPYIMLMGANGTETFVIATVEKAFQLRKVGLASAMAVVLLIIVLIVTAIQRWLVKDERAELS
jgi:multiple sugar transport system permease protein